MSLKQVKLQLAEKYERRAKQAKSKKQQFKHTNRARSYRQEAAVLSDGATKAK